jgi:hypothetical protein
MKTTQKKSKSYYAIFLCFIIVIIICSSGYKILDLNKKNSNTKSKIIAEIIESRYISDGNYELTVIYFINKTKYTSNLITKKKKRVGDKIDVYYDKDDPTIITENSGKKIFFMGNSVILCGLCMCLCLLITLFSKPKQPVTECNNNNSNNSMQNMKFPYFIPYVPVMN